MEENNFDATSKLLRTSVPFEKLKGHLFIAVRGRPFVSPPL